MNKWNVLLLCFLFLSSIAFSQNTKFEKPNYDKIEKEISKENSEFYYPKLLKRYLDSDTTLTIQEKRYLYYGYSFQEAYSPYGHSSFFDSIKVILKEENYSENNLTKVLKFSDSILIENPFNLNAINYQLYALDKLGNKLQFDNKINQMRIVIDALLSSGDGLKKKTAYYVIFTANEYDLLSILDFKFGGEQSLIEHYDYLTVAKNSQKIKGLYFDVSPCLNSLNKMFK